MKISAYIGSIAAFLIVNLLLWKAGAALANGDKHQPASKPSAPASESSTEAYPIDPTITADPAAPPVKMRELTAEEKEDVIAALRELYISYAQRNVKDVLKIIHNYTEHEAELYAAKHPDDKQAAQKIREAYQAFHEDIFRNADYQVEEFSPEFASYAAYPDGTVEVMSPVPIIGTKPMYFDYNEEKSTANVVRLRLGRFVLKPTKLGWQIVEMDLF